MIKKLYAVDESMNPVRGAMFTFIASDGTQLAAADGGTGGMLSLDSNLHTDLFAPGVHVRVTAAGYEAAGTDTNVIPDAWQFIMPKVASMLPALGLGALIAFGAFHLTKKESRSQRRVKGFDFKTDALPYVFPAAILIGGVIVYNKIFGDTPEQKKYNQSLDKGISDAAASNPPQLTDAQIAIMADTLSNDISSFSGQTNVPDIINQFDRVYTLADLLRLIKQYGTRYTFLLGIPRGKYDLQQSLLQNVDGDTINRINSHFANAAIDFQF